MAFLYDTGGYSVNSPTQDIDPQYLAGLKPLSHKAGISPAALSGWSVASARPESITQGALSGTGSIAQGLLAAQGNKLAQVEKDRLEKREEKLLQDKYKNEQIVAGLKERGKGSLPSSVLDDEVGAPIVPKKTASDDSETTAIPTSETAQDADLDKQALKDAASGGAINGVSDVSGAMSSVAPPTPNVAQVVASTPIAYTTASTGSAVIPPAPMSGTNAPVASTTTPSSTPQVAPGMATTQPISSGDAATPANEAADKAMANTTPLTKAQEAEKNYKDVESAIKSAALPRQKFNSLGDLQRYVSSQSNNPRYVYEGMTKATTADGGAVLLAKWKDEGDARLKNAAASADRAQNQELKDQASKFHQEDVLQKEKDRKVSQELGERRQEDRTIYAASRDFKTDPRVQALLNKSSSRSMLQPFVSAYMNAKKFPDVAGQADVSMMNLFGRAEGGGKITANEMHALESATSPEGKFKIMINHFGGGDMTYQQVRDQMLRELLESTNIGVDDANKAVTAARESLGNSKTLSKRARAEYFLGGHDPEHAFVLKKDLLGDPQAKPGIIGNIFNAITGRKPITHKGIISDNIDKMAQLKSDIDQAKADGKQDEVEYKQAQYDAIKKENAIWRKRLKEEADVDSDILGSKNLRDTNIEEGFIGSASPENVLTTEPPQGNGG
jgi:hypothetical protein